MGGKAYTVDGGDKSRKQKIEDAFRQWRKGGSKGIFANFGDAGIWGGSDLGDDSKKADPPPVDDGNGGGGGNAPLIGRPKSNSWEDIVAFNFPDGAGKYYKEGGLVRGGGKAVKGRGRGRMV